MKTSFLKLIVAGTGTAILLISCGVASHTEKVRGVDLYSYKTFALAKTDSVKKNDIATNEIIDENIRITIAEQMEKKGWTQSDKKPDLLINYSVAVDKRNRQNNTYNQTPVYGGRMRLFGMYTPGPTYRSSTETYNQGQLTINMIDSKNNKLLWQGWALDEINGRTVTTKQVQKDVVAIFKNIK